MSRKFTDSFPINGALPAPWTILSGAASVANTRMAFTTAPGSNPLAVVEMGLRSNGYADVDITVKPTHVYGNALYPRVADATNWIRAVLRSWTTTYQYYTTEYQHSVYSTEYEWNDVEWYDVYQPRKLQRQVNYKTGTCTYSAWSSWQTESTTGCRSVAPANPGQTLSSCGGTIKHYQVVDAGTTGCSGSQHKYTIQYQTRSWSEDTANKWVDDGYTLASGESFTGATQIVNNGATYNKYNGSSSTLSPGQGTTPTSSYDTFTGNTSGIVGTYWAFNGETTGPPDTKTGATRQSVSSTYWDQTYEAGAPTRQTGPYTGTTYHFGVELEKSINGVITSLGLYEHGATSLTALRVTAEGDVLKVYLNGGATASLTATCADHKTTGRKAGLGGGASSYNPTSPDFDDFNAVGLSANYVRKAGVMVRADHRLRINGAWVGIDRTKK